MKIFKIKSVRIHGHPHGQVDDQHILVESNINVIVGSNITPEISRKKHFFFLSGKQAGRIIAGASGRQLYKCCKTHSSEVDLVRLIRLAVDLMEHDDFRTRRCELQPKRAAHAQLMLPMKRKRVVLDHLSRQPQL